jgi:hypothetical protein
MLRSLKCILDTNKMNTNILLTQCIQVFKVKYESNPECDTSFDFKKHLDLFRVLTKS